MGKSSPRPMAGEDRLRNAPIGTKAAAIMGGCWTKVKHGWKWGKLDGGGGVYPSPGGDWDGNLIYPNNEVAVGLGRGLMRGECDCQEENAASFAERGA